MSLKTVIVTPVYNDWQSFEFLVKELSEVEKDNYWEIERIVAVNDGSEAAFNNKNFNSEIPISILNLNNNMGHQRAISVGLSYVEDHYSNVDNVLVMDSDGEDRPLDIGALISKSVEHNSKSIIFAKREKRSEGLIFKFFYRIYKLIFFALTSQKLDFGNFSCIPRPLLRRVVSIPETWNHYSGGIIKSKIPYVSVGTDRGNRYHGTSKMNFQNLLIHGFSSISIYLDLVSVRLLLASIVFVGITLIGLIVGVTLTVFTNINVPSWSSLMILSLINILAIVILTTFLILLFQLNQKNSVKFPPRKFYKDFLLSVIDIT